MATSYFNSTQLPLISSPPDQKGNHKHLAWNVLYDSLKTLIENLPVYLHNPPQIEENDTDYRYSYSVIPHLNESSYKLVFATLKPKELTPKQRIERESKFPLVVLDDIDQLMAKADIYF